MRIDPQRLAGHGLTLSDLRNALRVANSSSHGASIVEDNVRIPVRAGTFLVSAEEVGQIVVGLDNDKPVYLSDVADVVSRAETPKTYVTFVPGRSSDTKDISAKGRFPAATLTIAKQPGTNAVDIADNVIDRLQSLQGMVIPDMIKTTITRNYGATADAKAKQLITKLLFATGSVVILVWLTMGWRPTIVVGIAVIAIQSCWLNFSISRLMRRQKFIKPWSIPQPCGPSRLF